jgi:hypothetical protein
MRPLILSGFLIVGLSFDLHCADRRWTKPFTQWTLKDVAGLLQDSPWCRTMTLGTVVENPSGVPDVVNVPANRNRYEPRGHGLNQQTGITGEKEVLDAYSVRLFSAPPVRQAHARMLQLRNNYDGLPAEQKELWDERLSRLLNLDVGDRVVVTLEFQSNNRETPMEVNRQLATATASSLRQRVYLITARLGRIEATDYLPPSGDGMGAKFVFPRLIGGRPLLTPEDKELVFEFRVPGLEHKVFVTWDTAKLTSGRGLEY